MLLGLRHRNTSFESGLLCQCVWMYIHKVAHLSVKVHFQMVSLSSQWDLLTLLSGSQEFLGWSSICVLEGNSWMKASVTATEISFVTEGAKYLFFFERLCFCCFIFFYLHSHSKDLNGWHFCISFGSQSFSCPAVYNSRSH